MAIFNSYVSLPEGTAKQIGNDLEQCLRRYVFRCSADDSSLGIQGQAYAPSATQSSTVHIYAHLVKRLLGNIW